MNYAIVKDGIVQNIISLIPYQAQEFPGATPLGDVPVAIGDTWNGEHFYRGGERVLSLSERLAAEMEDMQAGYEILGASVGDEMPLEEGGNS